MRFQDLIARGLPAALIIAALGMLAMAPGGASLAQTSSPASVETGRVIADRDCSSCHAIGPTGESPFEGAPRWRDLHNRFDVADLGEALAEGISVGHEAMPARAYEPADVQALIAYLKSLESPAPVTNGVK